MRCATFSVATAAASQQYHRQLLLLPHSGQHSCRQPAHSYLTSVAQPCSFRSSVKYGARIPKSRLIRSVVQCSSGQQTSTAKPQTANQNPKQQQDKQKGQQVEQQKSQTDQAQQAGSGKSPQSKQQAQQAQNTNKQQQKQPQQGSAVRQGPQQPAKPAVAGHPHKKKKKRRQGGGKMKQQQQQQQQQQPKQEQPKQQQKQKQQQAKKQPQAEPDQQQSGKQSQQQPGKDKAQPTVASPAAFELPKPQLLTPQQQRQKLPQTVIASADVAAAAEATATAAAAAAEAGATAAAAAAAAIQATRGSTISQAAAESAGPWRQQDSSTAASSRGPVQQRPREVAGITYDLPDDVKTSYRAAGVVVYDFDGAKREPRLLLVHERKGVWNLPAGKVKFRSDREGHPEDTAARELEEETHGLIAAADSRAVLPYCPVMYSPDTKMAVYFMRYIGAERLPDLMGQRLAAGMSHPEAQGIDGMGLFTAEQLRAGVLQRIKKKAQAADSSSSSSHTASVADSSSSSTADSSPEQTSTAADAGTATDSLDVEAAGEGEQEGEVSAVVPEVPPFAKVLAAVQEGTQPLQLHMPVLMAKARIVNWLERLARDVAPAVGLHIKRDSAEEQQQQQGGAENLQAPAVWVLRLPSKWAAFEPVADAPNAADQASRSSGSSSSTHGQAFLSTGSSSSAGASTAGRSSASKEQTGSSAAADTAAAVELCEGEMQRWAIGVWSGQHARRQ